MNIRGSFTSLAKPGFEVQRIERLAYFSGNQFYSITRHDASANDLLREMRKYHVNYYFAYNVLPAESSFVDEQGRPFPEITKGGIEGLRVFVVNP